MLFTEFFPKMMLFTKFCRSSSLIGPIISTFIYFYTYTDKLLQVTTNPIYYPLPSKNLPATLTVTDGAGNAIGTVTYTYVFDSSGRVTKETDTEDNGDYVVKIYGY